MVENNGKRDLYSRARSRNIKILNRTVPLLPLIAALIIGSVIIGYAAEEFLTIITHPVQQKTYHREDTITIVGIPSFIEAFVTLEGEVNELGEFALDRPIDVYLVINSLRPNFKVSDDYALTINGELVISGSMVNVEPGAGLTNAGTWMPLTVGPAIVAVDITDMVWTQIQYATFTGVTFVEPEGKLSLVSDTLPLGVQIEVGTSVDFDFTVQNDHTESMNAFSYDVETSPDGSTWTSVASGSVSALIAPGETKTMDADFNAPPAEGTYEVRITISAVEAVFVTFTEFTFVPGGSGLVHYPETYINTLPIDTPILGGSTVTFDLQLKSGGGGTTIYGFLYDIDVSTDGGTTWGNVLTAGKVWEDGTLIMGADELRTFSVSFTAPLTADDYIVRFTEYDRSTDPGDEPGT